MDKLRMISAKIIVLTIGSMWLILGMSCEKEELTRSGDGYDNVVCIEDSMTIKDSINIDDKSGISFTLESDSLELQIEDVYFQTNEWEEEAMNAEL